MHIWGTSGGEQLNYYREYSTFATDIINTWRTLLGKSNTYI